MGIGIDRFTCEALECKELLEFEHMRCKLVKCSRYHMNSSHGCPVPDKCPNKVFHILKGTGIYHDDCSKEKK